MDFPDYEEVIFSNGGVKTGLEKFERSEEGLFAIEEEEKDRKIPALSRKGSFFRPGN